MTTGLSAEEKVILLKLARQSIQRAVNGMEPQTICVEDFPPALQDFGCSFVTLTIGGQLRGCIGALEPYLPLVQDVCEHAVSAATEDYRFSPVKPAELNQLEIEISHLSTPQPLDYGSPEELMSRLRPGIDGVILKDEYRRATFLPQVWEKIPAAEDFLNQLCRKMGAQGSLWRKKKLQVFVYQVEEFHEAVIS